jgi:hypothetical protein
MVLSPYILFLENDLMILTLLPPALLFPKGGKVTCWNSMNPEAFSPLKKGMKGGFPVFSKN